MAAANDDALARVLEGRRDIWRGGQTARQPTLASGRHQLDTRLGGGWPVGALTEILLERPGQGELALLLPALAAVSRRRWLALVAPPHIPYAPALARAGIDLSRLLWLRPEGDTDALWAAEQCLRSGVCGMVLAWPQRPDDRALRRLQLAAEQGGAAGILYRPLAAGRHPSPAALRLSLTAGAAGIELSILRQRGGRAGAALHLPH